MADNSQKSTAITGLDAKPIVLPRSFSHGGSGKHFVGVFTVADDASIGSVYRFFRIGSWMRPVSLKLFCGTLTAAAADFGLYRTAQDGGAVADVDFFASAQTIATASAVGIECCFEAANAASNMGIGVMDRRIWEVMGLSADPGYEYDVCATLTIAATDPGFLALQGQFTW